MSKRLLVADDAMIIREMIKDHATQAGWEVVAEAVNGQEAVARFAETRPDAVTLDMVMPEFDGMHALKGILKFDPSARVIVVSAVEQSRLLHDAFLLGAADFVVKPFDAELLVKTLEGAVGAAS